MKAFLISTNRNLSFRKQHSDRTVDQQNVSLHKGVMGVNL
jgi:hypothetical protein